MKFIDKLAAKEKFRKNFIEPDVVFVEQTNTFKLPIFSFNISDEIDIEKQIYNVKEYRSLNPEGHTTNIYAKNGWRSSYDIEKHTDVFKPVIDVILNKVKVIDKFINEGVYYDSVIMSLWAIIYKKGDYARWHHHFPKLLEGSISYASTLYLNDSQSALLFKQKKNELYKIYPKTGTLLIFSPLLFHSVEKLKDDHERIVLASNIGRLGKKDTNVSR